MASMLFPDSAIKVTGVRSNEKRHEDLVHWNEPAVQEADRYLICTVSNPRWPSGSRYTSDMAPGVPYHELMRMLREAEEVEQCS